MAPMGIFFCRGLAAVAVVVLQAFAGPSHAQAPLKLAVQSVLSGELSQPFGRSFLDGVRLAVEEANAAGGRRIDLEVFDDRGTEAGAREVAERIAASEAMAVVGPPFSVMSLAAGPIYARAGIASIVSAVESDFVTDNATTFRANFKNSDLGESLAAYLRHALGGRRAAVIYVDNAYGRPIADGFRRGAEFAGIAATFHGFSTMTEREEVLRRVAEDPEKPAIVLGTLDSDAAAAIVTLRKQGAGAVILGPTSLGTEAFAAQFAPMPEERETPGFFTRGVYATVPVMLDSANAETLAFAQRFRARFGKETLTWMSVQGYDGARVAIDAIRAAARKGGTLPARREAVLAFLKSLNGPARAVDGLLGPIWFTPDRGRQLPIRVGRFSQGLFESAPLQLVPVQRRSAAEAADSSVFAIGQGRWARLQHVVYAGIYLNEVSRVDVAQSTFTADLYVWIRFAKRSAAADGDPTRLEFPDLARGAFDSRQLAGEHDLDDGTTYRLWRVRGNFSNEFDLHRYPADRQTLVIRFFNARAASERLVYVLDRASFETAEPQMPWDQAPASPFGEMAAAGAFRDLSQWSVRRVSEARDNLVTESALGDPGLVGVERVRELSGFKLTVELDRETAATFVKFLLPIGLMTAILYATLFFPPGLTPARATVVITATLSGAVWLSSINAQLGNVGYIMAIEYAFYVFFTLCLLCIVSLLLGERLRLLGRSAVAVDRAAHILFLTLVTVMMTGGAVTLWLWH